jgi:DNA replication initiation complex subunit (GINS family)
MDLSELQEIDKKEKEGSGLSSVPHDFYARLRMVIGSKRDSISRENILSVREYENILMLSKRILSRRISKISYFASRNLDLENMTKEEMELYSAISSSAKALTDLVDKGLDDYRTAPKEAEKKEQEPPKAETKIKERRIRIVKFVDAYKGLDGSEYGPYSIGTVVSDLPDEEMGWLVEERYAEEI